ncbi:hypothetical protein, partial [Bartonella sp. AP57NXGY]|uniref:hypothetical protein n=1 Tax=Bartonella sp. AP57NXGY TaxID=3243497 RepID=UPI0035CF4522
TGKIKCWNILVLLIYALLLKKYLSTLLIFIFMMALMNGIIQVSLSAIIFMPNKRAIRHHPLY